MSRYPDAIWLPGPQVKQGYAGATVNQCRGLVNHSMVGTFANAIARLNSDDRASWTFSIRKDGAVYEHYEVEAVTWHAGTAAANKKYIGIEHEGGGYHANGEPNFSEPLTPPQLQASVKLARWLSRTRGFPLELKVGLWEHNWLYPTACPSGRIPWEFYIEESEGEMWRRHNEAASNAYWKNGLHTFGAGERAVLKLPVDLPGVMAKSPSAIDFDFYSHSGGPIDVLDGDGNFAGRVVEHGATIRAVPVNGEVVIQAGAEPATVGLGVVGYLT